MEKIIRETLPNRKSFLAAVRAAFINGSAALFEEIMDGANSHNPVHSGFVPSACKSTRLAPLDIFRSSDNFEDAPGRFLPIRK